MSFKTRLILSYVFMFIAPIILTIIAAFIIIFLNIRAVAGSYGFEFNGNPIKQYMDKNQKIFNDIKQETLTNPDALENKAYLESIEKELKPINTGIVVKKNNSIIYYSKALSKFNINKDLSELNLASDVNHTRTQLENNRIAVRYQDFYFNDKSSGTIFLITDMTPVIEGAQRVVLFVCAAIVLILIATDGLLTYFVSKSVLRPIRTLKKAADHIKEGDLEFEVKSASNDEIGQLCLAFEGMRKKLKESIELQIQYENNRKELISNISHDLKTPVTAIKGYVEGIIDGVADNPVKMDKYVKTIYSKASDLDQLIDELFLFSKLDLNKLPFNFEKVNIKNYLEDCVDTLRLDLEKDNISLNLLIENINNPTVLLDRDKMKRVIVNIAGNSTKYMDKAAGKIDIVLYDRKEDVKIEIRDNGKGISKEDIPFIFERFYRADPSRNSSTGGSGLGLAIVKRIIEEHGGKIWAESKEGIGTSIFFTLRKI